MKIDIHDIPPALLDGAMAGKRLVGTVQGTARTARRPARRCACKAGLWTEDNGASDGARTRDLRRDRPAL